MSHKSRILVVDDDTAVRTVLGAILSQVGYESLHADSAEAAIGLLSTKAIDLVISDLRMPGMDGFGLLERLRQDWPDIPLIILTAHGTVPIAVSAMQAGAADFMLKPFEREDVVAKVKRTLDATDGRRQAAPRLPQLGGLIGASPSMLELQDRFNRAALGTATVLLRGESGTGKELAAKLIHERSARSGQPFVVVDLGAVPDTLMESELFGHEKGAFTNASSRRPGRVELAQGGTLFLDEVGEVPLPMQVKLLRLLQEKEYRPLGAAQPQRADVRFIAATHRDLEAMVAQATFREDLYYRLSVVPIRIPPLRERAGDIARLSEHFCEIFARANGRSGIQLDGSALAALERYDWPGNVRELQNFLERLVVLSPSQTICGGDVDRELQRDGGRGSRSIADDGDAPSLEARLQQVERTAVATAIEQARGNRTLAARLLGISRRSLYNKLAEHGLE